jgi:hypothetical protein
MEISEYSNGIYVNRHSNKLPYPIPFIETDTHPCFTMWTFKG